MSKDLNRIMDRLETVVKSEQPDLSSPSLVNFEEARREMWNAVKSNNILGGSNKAILIAGLAVRSILNIRLDLCVIDVIGQVNNELLRATDRFKSFNSAHEGYAVLLEELEEMYETLPCNNIRFVEEAIQVAAMGCRFLLDVESLQS